MLFTQVAMIRGINVGGHRPIKMERLRGVFSGLGFGGVRTYLQSGNVVFEAEEGDGAGQADAIAGALRRDCGLAVHVLVRSARQLAAARRRNPLVAGAEPRFLHATFLSGAGTPSLRGIELPLGPGERAALVGGVVYLYCPNGYGTTKLHNQFFERRLGVPATTRNWATVTALEAMASGRAPR